MSVKTIVKEMSKDYTLKYSWFITEKKLLSIRSILEIKKLFSFGSTMEGLIFQKELKKQVKEHNLF